MHRSAARKLAAVALAVTVAGPAAAAQDGLQARGLAAACTTCHGGGGGAARAGFRALDGMPAATLVAAMSAFQNSTQAGVMQQLAKGYRDEQIALIAAYFAALPAVAP